MSFAFSYTTAYLHEMTFVKCSHVCMLPYQVKNQEVPIYFWLLLVPGFGLLAHTISPIIL